MHIIDMVTGRWMIVGEKVFIGRVSVAMDKTKNWIFWLEIGLVGIWIQLWTLQNGMEETGCLKLNYNALRTINNKEYIYEQSQCLKCQPVI